MNKPELVLVNLFVENPSESAAFYRKLLELEPVWEKPTFVMFVLPNGLKLGLWSKATVEPAATGSHGAFELSFSC
jgi:catechol 2,3-dioxygenase-like lactoylglutathione lyase family enzyme